MHAVDHVLELARGVSLQLFVLTTLLQAAPLALARGRTRARVCARVRACVCVCACACVCVCPVYVFACMCKSVCVCVKKCAGVYLYNSIYTYALSPFVSLSIYLSICLSLSLSRFFSLCVSVCIIHVCLCVSVCLCAFSLSNFVLVIPYDPKSLCMACMSPCIQRNATVMDRRPTNGSSILAQVAKIAQGHVLTNCP